MSDIGVSVESKEGTEQSGAYRLQAYFSRFYFDPTSPIVHFRLVRKMRMKMGKVESPDGMRMRNSFLLQWDFYGEEETEISRQQAVEYFTEPVVARLERELFEEIEKRKKRAEWDTEKHLRLEEVEQELKTFMDEVGGPELVMKLQEYSNAPAVIAVKVKNPKTPEWVWLDDVPAETSPGSRAFRGTEELMEEILGHFDALENFPK